MTRIYTDKQILHLSVRDMFSLKSHTVEEGGGFNAEDAEPQRRVMPEASGNFGGRGRRESGGTGDGGGARRGTGSGFEACAWGAGGLITAPRKMTRGVPVRTFCRDLRF